MASAFSHGVAALGIGACFYRSGASSRVWVAGVFCSVIPDLDVIGFRFGIRYGDFWGHRGFSHSLSFAALLASIVMLTGFRQVAPGLSRLPLWIYFFLATASHGFLDAMTDGGMGVAFFSRSTITVIPFPGHQSEFRPLALDGFLRTAGLSPSRVSSSGFGCPPRYWHSRPGWCAGELFLPRSPECHHSFGTRKHGTCHVVPHFSWRLLQ